MTFLEVILVVLVTLVVAGVPRSVFTRDKAWLWAAMGLAVVTILHVVVDMPRWQMVPTYAFTLVATGLAFWRHRRGPVVRRGWARALTVALAGFAGVLALLPPSVLPVPSIAAPSGPHAIGVRTVLLTDLSRVDGPAGGSGQAREVLVRLWYPAEPNTGGERLDYMTKAEARALSGRLQNADEGFVLSHMRRIELSARIDADPAEGSFPVLLFSHGFSGILNQSAAILQDLVSHGYIVVAIGHPGGAAVLEYPDGRVRTLAELNLGEALLDDEMMQIVKTMQAETDFDLYRANVERSLERTAMLAPFADQWSADQRFVIDTLEEEGFGDLSGVMDTSRIGVFGHSFGGSASVLTCQSDPRCDAVLNLDGQQYGGLMDETVRPPFLMIYTDHASAGVLYNDVAYGSVPGRPAFDAVIVRDTGHHDATELATLLAQPVKAHLPKNPAFGPRSAKESSRTFAALVRGFFDQHLRGETGALERSIDGSSAVDRHTPNFVPSDET
ncbi:hypothetical protein [uncultured Algimonas sp.]|uniref:alpha/beta hydrolase family protein n=1 Tax=uncultured Algimonas sp. TaxID=1547920 RepID=UPI0026194F8C|nr:hypothetical protein [uncultured Algimonas sp.]